MAESEQPEAVAHPITRRQLLSWSAVGLSGALAAGCSGGGLVQQGYAQSYLTRERLVVNPAPRTITDDRGVPTGYVGFLGTGIGAFVALWGVHDNNGLPSRITQSLYWENDPGTGTRAVFDGQGLPVRIEHEENGAFVLIVWEADRATFKFYQPSGSYIGGAVVSGETFQTTQTNDTEVVGLYTGEIDGLRDGVVSFTIGGRADDFMNSRPSRARTRQAPADGTLTDAQKTKALEIRSALSAWATTAQSAFAGRLLEAVARPIVEGKPSTLGETIVQTALAGTGLAPVFLRQGKPILDGLVTPFLILEVTGKLAGGTVAEFPETLGIAFQEVDPVAYRSSNALIAPRRDTDTTDIHGIAASRETGNVEVNGTIDANSNIFLSGTSAAGDLLEFTGQIDGTVIRGGRWKLRRAPGVTRDADGTWNGFRESVGRCEEQENSGEEGIFTNIYDLRSPGKFKFTYDAYRIPDRFQVFSENDLLFDTGGPVSGGQTVELTLSCLSTIIRVVVTAEEDGTAWEYTVGCPE